MKDDAEFTELELAQTLQDNAAECHPAPQHLERLRSELLAHTKLSTKVAPSAASSNSSDAGSHRAATSGVLQRRRTTWLQLATLAALILIAILATRPFSGTASADLASSLSVMRGEFWIHATTTIEYLGSSVESEAWYSPQLRIAAFRSNQSQHFVDYRAGVQSSHVADSDVVYRWRADPKMENFGSAFVKVILTDGDLTTIFPHHHVSNVQKSAVTQDGQAYIEYRFRLEWKSDRKMQVETVVLADRTSRRLISWDESHAGAKRILTRFDYPESGPRDVYELGASPDTKVIDRVASSDVVDLAEKFQQDVLNFDDYQALVIDRLLPLDSSANVVGNDSRSPAEQVLVRRIMRKGKEFRIDLVELVGDESWPNQIDVTWWRSNADKLTYRAMAICEGPTCTLYPVSEDDMPRLLSGMAFPPTTKPQTIPVAVLENDRGQTAVPVWPELWPEYACRPMIVPTDPTVLFEVDPAGTDGPKETIRLQVLAPDNPFASARASYWLALQHDYCLAKSLMMRPTFSKHTGRPVEEAVEASFSNFERSPSGIAFATRRFTVDTTTSQTRQTDFVVDFTQP